MPANREVEAYIYQAALARGIDPKTALAVSRSEALNVFDPSKPDRGGDLGSSFGPFQLHYGGMTPSMPNPGLGDAFTAKYGVHASDPSTWRQQVDFALDTAKQDGWRQWMGAKNTGIPRWAGIKTAGVTGEEKAMAPETQTDPNWRPARPGQTQSGGAGPLYPPNDPNWRPTRPGQQQSSVLTTPLTPPQIAAPYTAPPLPAAPAKKDWRENARDMLAKAVSGMAGTAGTAKARTPYVQPKAAQITEGAVPTIDPQQALQQRQQMAEIMAKLNAGKLWM
jgi:hypothetical protein